MMQFQNMKTSFSCLYYQFLINMHQVVVTGALKTAWRLTKNTECVEKARRTMLLMILVRMILMLNLKVGRKWSKIGYISLKIQKYFG